MRTASRNNQSNSDLLIHRADPVETQRLIDEAVKAVTALSNYCQDIALNGRFKERDHYKHKMYAANAAYHLLWNISKH